VRLSNDRAAGLAGGPGGAKWSESDTGGAPEAAQKLASGSQLSSDGSQLQAPCCWRQMAARRRQLIRLRRRVAIINGVHFLRSLMEAGRAGFS